MELLKKIYCIIILLLYCCLSVYSQQDNVYDLSKGFYADSFTSDEYIYYEEQNNKNVGRWIINLNTLNQENIKISWQNTFFKKTNTKWFVRLQYRLSVNDEWQEIKEGKNNIEFVTSNKRYTKNFSDIKLPQSCSNKSFIQVCFYVDTYTNNKINYPDIVFKNLKITSEYDKYLGIEPVIRVYNNDDDKKENIKEIDFGKISLPYVFAENRRFVVQGQNIRDSITLRLVGKDVNEFVLSQKTIKKDFTKTISLQYIPKKEGNHTCQLIISTNKLKTPIIINIEGRTAKNIPYNTNLLPLNNIAEKNINYHIPVFSNTEYQYKFLQSNNTKQQIYILYRWYKDNQVLFSMYDTVKTNAYCVALTSPKHATSLDINLSANNSIMFDDYYFGTPTTKKMIKSGSWSDANNWQPKGQPNIEDFVIIDSNIVAKVDDDALCNTLILNNNSNININTGKIFYVANNISYGQNAFFTVHQYLLPSKWNYISSPVNQARAAIFSLKNAFSDNDTWLMQYNTGYRSKLDDYWSEYITNPEFILNPGKGYAVYTHQAMDVKYEGLLCNSNVVTTLISTPQDRWNLIGNPYTAPLSSKKLFEDIDGKIQGNTLMLFDRQTKVYNPLIIDSKEEVMIPSLESFFVEALDIPTEITFKRSHQYIPKTTQQVWTNNNYLNLSVSRNKDRQYVLLGMDDKSSFDFDEKDCHKMFGNNADMPEIYLKYKEDEFAVNVFPNYPAIYDIGLYIGNPSEVEINLNNLSIMPDYVQIFIEDKITNEFIDMCSYGKITTFLQRGTTEKYRIHIIKSINIPNIKDNATGIYLWQDKDYILFYSNMNYNTEKIKIIKNNNVITETNYKPYDVYSKQLEKGKYKISLLIKEQWTEFIDFEIQ